MKKIGRGQGFRKSLVSNLVRSLTIHKKIKTTRSRAKLVKRAIEKIHGETIQMIPLGNRRGDNAPQVVLEWKRKENVHEKHTDKTKNNTKRVASR